MSYNRVIMQGFLSSDVELKATAAGKTLAKFQIAVNRVFRKNSEERSADFFDCVAFGFRAEHISRCYWRGKAILISGQLRNDVWVDREGKRQIKNIIQVDECSFADSNRDKVNEESPIFGKGYRATDEDIRAMDAPPPPPPPPLPDFPDEPPPADYEDDLPF